MAKQFYSRSFVEDNTHKVPTRISFKDITGNKFGKVSVISWAGINRYGNWKSKRNVWWCECECSEDGYFLVDRVSLEKGLTTSCGCKYKDNKGGHLKKDILDVSSSIDPRYTLKTYEGKRKPCEIVCSVCKEYHEVSSFYSLQQQGLVCSCKPDTSDTVITNMIDLYNYKVLSKQRGDNNLIKYCLECKSCKVVIQKGSSEIKDKCPCHYAKTIRDVTTASAVYLLADRNNKGVFKIGKGNMPVVRSDTISKSVDKNGYSHDFYVYATKWFASEQVAYYVESLYHQFFKEKVLYTFKGYAGVKVFDGSCEVFSLTKQDFLDFNRLYKKHIEFLQVEDIPYVVDHPFRESCNVIYNKSESVGMWFPSKISLANYYNIPRNGFFEGVSIVELLMSKYEKDFLLWHKEYLTLSDIIIDGKVYKGGRDFYQQHKTIAKVEYKMFKDRFRSKGWCPWKAITTPRLKNRDNKFYDVDGTEMTCSALYKKYKPNISFGYYKKKLLGGGCPLELKDFVPDDYFSCVYLVGGKYYSHMSLYDLSKPYVSKPTYYGRLKRGWCPLVAACTETTDKSTKEQLNSPSDGDGNIVDIKKYNELKLIMGVSD